MANYDLDYEGSVVQDILDTGKSLEDDGYIFLGTATPSTIPGTPTERVAYVGGPGTYNNFGTTVVVPSGSVVVITYSGSAWTKTVINASLPVSTTLEDNDTTIPTGKAVKTAIDAINTKLGEGYLYAGIATAATNPGTPIGKVFYLARQAGTYTNFGGLTLTEGVNILKYNGTAWSQEQLISIADIYKNPLMGYYECDTAGGTAAKTVAATGYVLPATGGSVKIKMANRNTVANATLNINSTGAKPLFYNGVRAGVGNTWDTNEVIEVYYDGTNYQAHNVAGSSGDGVFDISAYNLTDGQPTPYVELSAALGTDGANVPQSLRKGGMSVKFIQGSVPSSDNNYQQFRYLPVYENTTAGNAAFVNTDNWSFCGDDVLVEDPEFLKVYTDSAGKVLWAIKADGRIYYGAGIPQQVINYIQKKIEELSLDEYEDIVSFLGSLIEGDKTLQQLLDEKVDKVEGKGLSTNDYDNTAKSIVDLNEEVEDPEYAKVITDSGGKVLQGIKSNGTKYIGADEEVQGDLTVKGKINNLKIQEEIDAKVDKETGKSLINSDFASSQNAVDDPEFIDVKTDSEDKILEAITVKGRKKMNIPVDTPSFSIETVDDKEWVRIKTDGADRILEGRKRNGKKVVFTGVEFTDVDIREPGMSVFANKVKRSPVNGEILNLNPREWILPVLKNLKFQYGMWGGVEMAYKRLTFLWFTDIHHDDANVRRIHDFYEEYHSLIDDVFTTGDFVRAKASEDFSWWNENGGQGFLLTLGNHDAQDDNGIVSPKYCYDKYMKDSVPQWGVTISTNKNYWYKDYIVRDSSDPTFAESPVAIRIICIDQYHWKEMENFANGNWDANGDYPDGTSVDTGEQEQWFKDRLTEAASLNYAVITILHAPTNDFVPIPCAFHALDQIDIASTQGYLTEDMIDDVDHFIAEQGGTFIAWVTGHVHQDWIGRITDHPQQLLLSIGHAGHTTGWKFDDMVEGTKSQDRFNLLSIEPLKGYLRMFRVGLEYDRNGRHIESLIYDYKNRNLIYSF